MAYDIVWAGLTLSNWENAPDLPWEKQEPWYIFGLVWVGLNFVIKVGAADRRC